MNRCSLYRHFDEKENLLYIGISCVPLKRTSSHEKNASWFGSVASISINHFDSKKKALIAERKSIAEENPIYNNYRPDPNKDPVLLTDSEIDNKSESKSDKDKRIASVLETLKYSRCAL